MKPEAQHQFGSPQQLARRLVLKIGLALLLLLPSLSQALEFQCELNGDVRQLSVLIPGEQHLCEVSVDYESTGERKVLWHADNDSLFCSAKAYALIGKYENEWGFSCAKWPDRDGVDELSATQRSILDLQLKKRMIEEEIVENPVSEFAIDAIAEADAQAPVFVFASDGEGDGAEVPVSVLAVKATASTPLDQEPGALAIQYFLSDGSDQTEIINIKGTSWSVFATIDNMANHVTGAQPVDTALISTITDGGALEIVTTMRADDGKLYCYGRQVLMPDANSQLNPRTPHRIVCEASASLAAMSD